MADAAFPLSTRFPLTRRALFGAAASALAGSVGAGGCGRGPGGVTRVRFWNGFTGPDGRTMLRLVRRFNAANPDVQVLMQRMDWATYYNKLFVAGLGGRAPELFVLHTKAMERFARAGFARPNDDLLGGPRPFDPADLDAHVWRAVDFGGRHYGLPLDVHPVGMYYNRRLLREAGIAAPPQDRDSFVDALRRLRKPGRGGQPDQWGFVFTNFESNVYTLMRQFGGAFFTPDQSRCVLNNAENARALAFCSDLIRKENLVPPPENFDAWIGFRQGRVGMAFEGVYMLADLQKQKDLEFGGAPVPVIGDRPATAADSHNLCLRSDLKGRELDATWRFATFLSDNSLDWAEGGQVPARRSLRATDRFARMPVQAAFAEQIPYVQYLPRLPFVFEYQTEFNLAVEKVLRGRESPEAALALAETNINRIMARDREGSAPTWAA